MEKNTVLNLYPIDYPFETLVDRVDKNKLILTPDFQRKYKWNDEKASHFIESCLMRIPLPACYFAEDESKNHLVIDGVQRITTIKRFIKDEFALEELTTFKDLNGKKFSELETDYRNDIENYTIRCIILRNDNNKEIIRDIFARLNKPIIGLTAQEIRHALYPGNLDNLLSELAKVEKIKQFGLGKRGNQERKDGLEAEEQVLRFLAMQGDLSDYKGRLSKYLDSFMEKNQKLSDEKAKELQELFNSTLNKCLLVFGNRAFTDPTKTNSKESLVHYDLLMWSFSQYDKDFLIRNKEKIQKLFKELCSSNEFKKLLSDGLQHKSAILARRNLWSNKMKSINEQSEHHP